MDSGIDSMKRAESVEIGGTYIDFLNECLVEVLDIIPGGFVEVVVEQTKPISKGDERRFKGDTYRVPQRMICVASEESMHAIGMGWNGGVHDFDR